MGRRDDNIMEFSSDTTLDISPDKVLAEAAKEDLLECVVLGYDANGSIYVASSTGHAPDILWLMELVKFRLLSDEP